MTNQERVVGYWLSRFNAMEAAGFPLLQRIPSFEASRFPQVLATYSEEDRVTLKELLANRAAKLLGYSSNGLPVEGDLFFSEFLTRRLDRSRYPDFTKPRCRASELRKVAKLTFEQLLGATPAKAPNPGDWQYTGFLLGHPVSVEVRYAVSSVPFKYTVRVGDLAAYGHLNFETLYGFGLGYWDFIFSDNIDQAFATLKDVITTYVEDYLAITRLIKRRADADPKGPGL